MGGPPARGQIGGRRDDMHVHIGQPPRPQRTVGHVGDADGRVQPHVDDVDMRVRQMQVDIDQRMFLRELSHQRRHAQQPERHRRAQPHHARQVRRLVPRRFLRRLSLGQDALRMIGQPLAAFGQRQPPAGAVEQAGVEMLLQPRHRL